MGGAPAPQLLLESLIGEAGFRIFVTIAAATDRYLIAATNSAGPSLFLVAATLEALHARPSSPRTRRGRGRVPPHPGRCGRNPDRRRRRRLRVGNSGLSAAYLALAAETVGICDRLLRMTVFCANRASRTPIGSFHAVKHRYASMLVDLACARASALYAARAVESGAAEAELAKLVGLATCRESADRVSRNAMQVHGG